MTARTKSLVREYVEAIVIAVALALVIRSFVVQAFKIPSGSMIPTLLIGDHLLVNKLVYRFRTPERGEVVVFKFPQDHKTDFIKRVVALPGDRSKWSTGS
jgi:signal peptidase I